MSSIVCVLWVLCVTMPVQAEDSFQPGFKTLGIWVPEKNLRLDINVWYPSVRLPFEVNYSPWRLQVARFGREVPGRFPLLLLSHDSSGTRFSYHETAAYLARSGFVVAAPTHDGDNMDNMPNLFTLEQLTGRVEQLKATLDTVLTHSDISASIDPDRIGVIGFGAGGTAALLMGGALPDSQGWAEYCAKAGENDAYCSSWAAQRMRGLVERLPLKASLADVRVKAVAAVTPGYGMLFSHESLRYFYPRLLLLRVDGDTINQPLLHTDAIFAALPRPAQFASLGNADAAALMSACPPELQADLPELCGTVSPDRRQRVHARLNSHLGRFFIAMLGDTKKLPEIPPPPDLTPPAPVKIKPQAVPEQKKKRRAARREAAPAQQ